MSERKPVMCPWCGEEMVLASTGYCDGFSIVWMQCKCGAESPKDRVRDDTLLESAYIVATRRPENRPLLLPEVFSLEPESDAVWIVTDKAIMAMSAEAACEWASDADTVLFFAHKPTPEDIGAARKEANHE